MGTRPSASSKGVLSLVANNVPIRNDFWIESPVSCILIGNHSRYLRHMDRIQGMSVGAEGSRAQPVLGILLNEWFDGWLDTLGMSLDVFSHQMMGSWVFNYVEALHEVGVKAVIYCVSTQVTCPTRLHHSPTGATIVIVPPPRIYRVLRLAKTRLFERAHVSEESLPHGLRANSFRTLWAALASVFKPYCSTPLISLFREMQRDECGSLLVQEYESIRFDLCVLWGSLRRTPVYGTFTGGRPFSHWIRRPFRTLAMRWCAGLAIGARREVERVKGRYRMPSDKMALIYSSVDQSIYYASPKEESRKTLAIPDHVKLVVYHGRIELSFKGLDVLLEAWKQLQQSYLKPDLRLLVIGTGSDAEEFKRLLAENHVPGVHWVNEWVHDRDLIRRYLTSADVYVFPSRGDACPNAVIEAMACGLPIVASDVNGIADLLDRGGILVPPGNAHALTEALRHVLDNPALTHELGRRAQGFVRSRFSTRAVGEQLRTFMLPAAT
ncbi:MAG: glycosyltransferase family 1 protein [Chloroflexi bacterium]|nr:MAG: glycosyltransferase family 1 protein [Chloroflexota bacterium]